MPNDRPIDELIDRCLDKTASKAERQELERRLQDADARAAFVAAQRLNASLEALLKEETQTTQGRALVESIEASVQRTRPSWPTMAAVAAATLMVFGAGLASLWNAKTPGPALTTSVASNREPPPERLVVEDMSPVEAVAMFGLASAKAVK